MCVFVDLPEFQLGSPWHPVLGHLHPSPYCARLWPLDPEALSSVGKSSASISNGSFYCYMPFLGFESRKCNEGNGSTWQRGVV